MKRRLETNPNSLEITSPFWKLWRKKVAEEVIPYQWEVINDEREICPPKDASGGGSSQEYEANYSHAVRNLKIAAGKAKGPFSGFVFQDSDVYKWLEEAAYALSYTNDKSLRALCDKVVDLIASAQLADGYLDTPYQIKTGKFKTRKRFTQIQQSHEMYVMGHYIEAGVAYYQVTGNKKALDIAMKMADCLDANFGPAESGKIPGADGHPEIELALARLYEVTGDEKYLDLGKFFLTIRGQDPYFYDKQNAKIGDGTTDIFPIMRTWTHEYSQAARPIVKQQTAEGHAVRVAYMLTGVAHIGRLTGDKELIDTAHRLWNNIVHKRMYITGAVGSNRDGEAYSYDYDLPNDIMYGESCASVGLTVFANRMMQIDLRGEYGDIIEKELYNSGISGIALDGKHFYYVNPLEADPYGSEHNSSRRHVLTERAEWFECACCPSNIARYIAGVHRFIYTLVPEDRTICAHQYIANKATLFDGIKVEQKSNFPWDGDVEFKIEIPKNCQPIKFAVRIPGWTDKKYTIKLDGKPIKPDMRENIAYIPMKAGNYKLNLSFDMSIKFMRSNSSVRFDAGKVCVMRGPVVYCAEGADNPTPLWNFRINHEDANKAKAEFRPSFLDGVVVIRVPAVKRITDAGNAPLYADAAKGLASEKMTLKLIPYYAWANRGANPMLVWFDSDI